jgi:caa(3)-type oxidase subunit IV
MAEATHDLSSGDHGHHSNTVSLLGREITVEGGVYTVVFGGLAILTVIEVLSAEFLKGAIHDSPDAAVGLTAIKAILLLGIAIIKSSLVIWFYMHLKDEKRIVAVVLLLPLLIAALSVMFVLAVPPTGYGI